MSAAPPRQVTTAPAAENPWDRARRKLLKRTHAITPRPEPIDRGVNYFLLQLERLGLTTEWSCEGHPAGWYLTFAATYMQALLIHSRGFFVVEIVGENYWKLNFPYAHKSTRERNQTLRSRSFFTGLIAEGASPTLIPRISSPEQLVSPVFKSKRLHMTAVAGGISQCNSSELNFLLSEERVEQGKIERAHIDQRSRKKLIFKLKAYGEEH